VNAILKWYLRVVLARPIIRAIDWTPQERNAFDSFCQSSCGIKLFEFLRQVVANATFNSVYQDKVSANARARGMQDLLAVLHKLRVFPALNEQVESGDMLEDSEPRPPSTSVGRAESRRSFIGGRGAIG
jgi:hypothetical protein